MNTAQKETQQAMSEFESNCRDLLACMKDSKEIIFERTAAAASLDKNVREDLTFFSTDLDQENKYARDCARTEFRKTVYAAIAKAFCNLLGSGTLRLAMKLTPEADEQQLELRFVCGIEQRPAPAPVVPVLSPAEAFDAMIRDDWAHMPMDKLKIKKNQNAQYRKRLNEMLENGTLESQITQSHDGRNM